MTKSTARLLISCPDAKGIIAGVAAFIAQYEGNIVEADQHVDPEHGDFFMRVEIELDGFRLNPGNFAGAWGPFAERFAMRWSVEWSNITKRVGIFVSKQSHCLNDLLWRWQGGELDAEIPLVISNHRDCEAIVRNCGIEFQHVPVTPENKAEQEARQIELLEAAKVDVIVLARYMQVLTPEFVAQYPNRIINIHHSFLPAFAGRRPYHAAYERGVKIIGATSHYVTDRLDDGPIIAQATLAVDHRDAIDDLIRKGRDLERMVLARAVRLHVQDKILVSRNKTVVFD
ncbi:MAG: formyltetrahydrofolate deformylase [Phycisphaerae bacterium]|nr:formyltetrahydrofolate deformylase [Phycisphaerae bacterium]